LSTQNKLNKFLNHQQMKKTYIIAIGILAAAAGLTGCKDHSQPGRIYMPDMAYSRAYETYAPNHLADSGINYTALPVEGTVQRGGELPYHLPNDSTGYALSASVLNPITSMSADSLKEAERIYLINCGICHGQKLDGNGPLWKGGDGPFPAAPRKLVGDPYAENLADGTMFHSITYGKNLMGSYASQLSTKQRWMVVYYIREKQKAQKATAAPAATAVKADSTATAAKK
jgi:mono/diheme cytochrome c family protein